jgi:hypothetical protein
MLWFRRHSIIISVLISITHHQGKKKTSKQTIQPSTTLHPDTKHFYQISQIISKTGD